MERIERLLEKPVSRRWILHATVIGLAGGALGLEIKRKSDKIGKKQIDTQKSQPQK